LRSVFLDERSGICVPSVPVTRAGFSREIIECKESWIGKQPVQVPFNVTITLEGQNLKVKGLLGGLSRNYPQEVKIERDENGILQVKKAVDTRIANQMRGLFR
jgi:large subunit ribosomal protein L6